VSESLLDPPRYRAVRADGASHATVITGEPVGLLGGEPPLRRADQVTDAASYSRLGAADYALAFADELETPRTRRAWLAVGY